MGGLKRLTKQGGPSHPMAQEENPVGTFFVKLTDGSEMILTAGRATRTDSGDVAFENVDARGNWRAICTVQADQVTNAYARKVREDGSAIWEEQTAEGRWWAY
ncbi:hypothetical protein AB0P36_33865 [Streptomyces flavidovirens]|uniref:hypothetical protein n=1 Tax=Streptomyces flavidovirens TaxID=67298 RepID=UPI0034205E44